MSYTQMQINTLRGQKVASSVRTPAGYEFVSKRTYTPVPLPPAPASPLRETWNPKEPIRQVTEYTFAPTFEDVMIAGNAMLPRKITPEEAKRAQEAYLRGEQPFQTMEEQALIRLTAATTVATGVTVPIAGALGLGAVGVGEGVKVGVTGKHLTVEEAVTAASIGVIAGVIGIKTAPYAKSAYSKMVNALSPERAMYNRVIAAQQAQEANTQSIMERFMGKVSPERVMYSRVVKEPYVGGKSTDTLIGGGGGSRQWVQQQVLLKQAPQVKSAMKPFTVTSNLQVQQLVQVVAPATMTATKLKAITRAQQKTTRSLIQVSMTRTSQQQIINPFLQFPGKAYYQKSRSRAEEILYPIVYPSHSPLSSPASITKLAGFQGVNQALLQKQILDLTFGQKQMPLQIQEQKQEQITSQVQNIVETVYATQKQKQTTQQRPRFPMFPLGGGGAGTRSFDRLTGKWFPRKHKVKPWDKMLKTFGFTGKVPKNIQRISRMEAPGFTRSKRKKTKRTKRRRKR